MSVDTSKQGGPPPAERQDVVRAHLTADWSAVEVVTTAVVSLLVPSALSLSLFKASVSQSVEA